MKYYSAIKRRITCHLYNMNGLGGIMLSEINQTEKDKYCIESLVCGILKKKAKRSNSWSKSWSTEVVARGSVRWGCGGGEGGREDRKRLVTGHKLSL